MVVVTNILMHSSRLGIGPCLQFEFWFFNFVCFFFLFTFIKCIWRLLTVQCNIQLRQSYTTNNCRKCLHYCFVLFTFLVWFDFVVFNLCLLLCFCVLYLNSRFGSFFFFFFLTLLGHEYSIQNFVIFFFKCVYWNIIQNNK